jgi:hypothetical protein
MRNYTDATTMHLHHGGVLIGISHVLGDILEHQLLGL